MASVIERITDNVMNSPTMASVTFENIGQILDLKDEDIFHRNRATYQRYMYSSHRNVNWFGRGANNAQDVVKRAMLGWKEGYELVEHRANELRKLVKGDAVAYKQNSTKTKRIVEFADQGDEIDIHKVYQGNLGTAWRRTKRITVDKTHHLVTVMVDVGGNGDVKVDDSLWRAAVAWVLVEDLVAQGKSVKVIIGSSCSHLIKSDRSKEVTTDIVVKNYNEPLSPERLAGMANVGFHRVYNFCARCVLPYKINEDMGHSTATISETPPLQIQEQVKKGHTRYVYVSRSTSVRSAVKSLESCYKQMKEFAKVA